jgi:hypothetical protein
MIINERRECLDVALLVMLAKGGSMMAGCSYGPYVFLVRL